MRYTLCIWIVGIICCIVLQDQAASDPWPLPEQQVPRWIVQTMGEYAIPGPCVHNGVDIPAPLASQVLAIHGGAYYPAGEEVCNVTGYPGGQMKNSAYQHVVPLPPNANPPSPGEQVETGRAVGQITANAYGPHLHLAINTANNHFINPLQLLTPSATFGNLQIRAMPDLPQVVLTRDGQGIGPEEMFPYKFEGNEVTYRVNANCDVLAWVESHSLNVPARHPTDVDPVECLPYSASIRITKGQTVSLAKTLFRFADCPDMSGIAQKTSLLYKTDLCTFYRKFVIILTNCDGTGNFTELANVVDSCWPVGEKEAGQWKVEAGLYDITVTVSDTSGNTASATVRAKVDHSMTEFPGNK
ncbi:MAG: hypothetical protein ACYC63_10895 [Armatimonadota bacterium]